MIFDFNMEDLYIVAIVLIVDDIFHGLYKYRYTEPEEVR